MTTDRTARIICLIVVAVIGAAVAAGLALPSSSHEPQAPSIEFYQLDHKSIVAYRGERPITHDELRDLVKALNRVAVEVKSEK